MMNKPVLIDMPAAIARMQAATRVLVTTHTRADGDAYGSALALTRVLRQQGKSVRVALHEAVSRRYAFLVPSPAPEQWSMARAAEMLSAVDLFLLVDTCAAPQVGILAELLPGLSSAKLAIDHHQTRDGVVDEAVIDVSAGACSLILSELFDLAGWDVDATTADLLFAGLATDTGWFRFSNADQRAFSAGARLTQAGARPNVLYEKLYLNDGEPRARLAGEVLSKFELHAGGRLAFIRLTRDAFHRTRADESATEDLINEPMRIGTVIACAQVVEPRPGEPVRVSLRSKRDVDVAAVAAALGGGGHVRAAGAKVTGPFDAVADRVLAALLEALAAAQPGSANPGAGL